MRGRKRTKAPEIAYKQAYIDVSGLISIRESRFRTFLTALNKRVSSKALEEIILYITLRDTELDAHMLNKLLKTASDLGYCPMFFTNKDFTGLEHAMFKRVLSFIYAPLMFLSLGEVYDLISSYKHNVLISPTLKGYTYEEFTCPQTILRQSLQQSQD